MSIKDFHALLQGGSLRSLVAAAAGTRRKLDDGSPGAQLIWTDW